VALAVTVIVSATVPSAAGAVSVITGGVTSGMTVANETGAASVPAIGEWSARTRTAVRVWAPSARPVSWNTPSNEASSISAPPSTRKCTWSTPVRSPTVV
jgi:hypothetical protein